MVATIVSLGDLCELLALSRIAVLMQFGTSALAQRVLAWRRELGPRSTLAWPALADPGPPRRLDRELFRN
jgi:hypothetical protein